MPNKLVIVLKESTTMFSGVERLKSRMSPYVLMAILLVASFLSSTYVIADKPADKKNYELSTTATLASDYIFRGVSQTLEDPAVQASFDVAHHSGVSAGIWSSNVDLQDRGPTDDQADQEIDLYVAYTTTINQDWSIDATAITYIFPGTAGDSDLDWNEVLFGAHYRDSISVLVAYSSSVFNLDDDGIYYGLSGQMPIPNNVVLTASIGYYDLDDALNDSYIDWSIGAEISRGIFTARLAYIDTDSSGENLFADNADARAVFSLTAAWSE